jgi:hypothetical protein
VTHSTLPPTRKRRSGGPRVPLDPPYESDLTGGKAPGVL